MHATAMTILARESEGMIFLDIRFTVRLKGVEEKKLFEIESQDHHV